MTLKVLKSFPEIAVGDVQDYDIKFTDYITSMGELADAAHEIDFIEAAEGLTIDETRSNIYNGMVIDGVSHCLVKVWVEATEQGSFEVVVRIVTPDGRKHTALIMVNVEEAM